MKRVITALLAALLVLSLAACGSGVETKKLAGTWTCTIDVTDRMNAAAEQALGLSAADGTAQMPLHLGLTVAEDGAVTGTPDRSTLRAVQTPQVFEADLLKAALQSALENEVPVTDDCSAVERLGKVVYLIDGDEENLKITTPVDLVIAEAILAEREGR